LRAIAALAVVWHHIQTEMAISLGTPQFGYAGRAGVDIFFVISGFIMFHTTQDGGRTTLQFWRDRVIRIAPMYWLATLAAATLFWLGIHPGDIKALSPVDVVEDMLFIPHYSSSLDVYPTLDVGWTLNYEMFFYFLFGLTFFLKSQPRALAMLAVIFLGGAALVHFNAPMPHAFTAWLEPITLEFVAGGALALLYRRQLSAPAGVQKAIGVLLVVAGFAAAGWFGFADGKDINWFYERRALEFGIPSVCIVAGALLLERNGMVIRSPFMLMLGAASYAIYLVHHVIVQYMLRVLAAVAPDAPAVLLVTAGLVIFALATAAGIAAHFGVEKPITRVLKRLTPNSIAASSVQA